MTDAPPTTPDCKLDVTGAAGIRCSAWLDAVLTGDSREASKHIADESVDMVLTDPPYGIGFKYSHDYKDDPETYRELMSWVIAESSRVVKPGCFCFVFQAMLRLQEMLPMFPAGSRVFAACKNFVQMRPSAMQYGYDPVIVWQKPGKYPLKPKGRDWHVANTANTNNRGINDAGFHACPRPLDTIEYIIENWSPAGGLVVDWFMGSGTTAVAAKRLRRHWLGWEIDEQIAEAARRRVASVQGYDEQVTLELERGEASNNEAHRSAPPETVERTTND